MRLLAALGIGLVFGIGISFAGMINPAKVLNFFDVTGAWDPSLAFVMAGALAVTFVGYRAVLRRSSPLLEADFQTPTNRVIDTRLIGGSALFGIGWGIAGFCPGGALPALGLGEGSVYWFILALIAGMVIAKAAIRAMAANTP